MYENRAVAAAIAQEQINESFPEDELKTEWVIVVWHYDGRVIVTGTFDQKLTARKWLVKHPEIEGIKTTIQKMVMP